MKARRARFAAAMAAAALIAAACSGDATNGDGEGAATQASAAPATTAAPPTTVSPTTAAPPPPSTALPTAASSSDALDLLRASVETSLGRSVRGDMTLMLPEPGEDVPPLSLRFEADAQGDVSAFIELDGEVALDPDAPDDASTAGIALEYRSVSAESFVRVVVPPEIRDFSTVRLPPEGWFTVGPEAVDVVGPVCPTAILGQLGTEGGCEFPDDMSGLLDAATGAEIVGTEDLGGTSTTRIDVSIDLSALIEQDPSAGAIVGDEDLTDFLVSDLLPVELTVSFWVDSDGLMRRMGIDLAALLGDLMGAFTGESADLGDELPELGQTVNFYDYDADISIEAPPADEIVGDFGDLMGFDL